MASQPSGLRERPAGDHRLGEHDDDADDGEDDLGENGEERSGHLVARSFIVAGRLFAECGGAEVGIDEAVAELLTRSSDLHGLEAAIATRPF